MNIILQQKNNTEICADEVKKLADVFGLSEKFVELLFSRGICTENDIQAYLYPDIANFHDPFIMKGMAEAVERIRLAIDNGEKIVVYGDYDADGICANAILSLYFTSLGIDVYSHTPNRIGDGYGLNNETLEKIIENVMPDLIITCDCGISCIDEVELVKDLGVDIIVTDHHEAGERIPDCVVVNPKQAGCEYPFKGLCGAGVVLKLIQALSGIDTMMRYIDLCTVATIADLVPLMGENRLIVQLGLKKIAKTDNIGLKALLYGKNMVNITASDIAFKISPRINAAGRMGDAYRAYELLTTSNKTRAMEIVAEIEKDNDRRKELCAEMYEEAIGDIKFEDIVNNRSIILCNAAWEKGITGILAARLCGDFVRPAIVLAKSGELFKATCRSIQGINMYDILTECADLLTEYGGHSQAAGFSILPEKIEDFKKRVNTILSRYDESLFLPKSYYDMPLDLKDIDYNFVKSLELLEPTGNENQRPTFKVTVEEVNVSPCKNSAHISISPSNNLQIFAFNYSHLSYQLMSKGKKDLVVELQCSTYNARDVKGYLKACSPEQLYINQSLSSSYNQSLVIYPMKDNPAFLGYENVDDVYDNCLHGVLVIADNAESYSDFVAKHDMLIREYSFVTTKNNYSRIVVAPDLDDENLMLANYEKIIFLFRPINTGVISYINGKTKATIYLPNNAVPSLSATTDRSVFKVYYDMLKRSVSEECRNTTALYKKIKKDFAECDYSQLVFCMAVFNELGIIKVLHNPFKLELTQKKADLSDSVLYRTLLKEEENAGR